MQLRRTYGRDGRKNGADSQSDKGDGSEDCALTLSAEGDERITCDACNPARVEVKLRFRVI